MDIGVAGQAGVTVPGCTSIVQVAVISASVQLSPVLAGKVKVTVSIPPQTPGAVPATPITEPSNKQASISLLE